MKTREEILNQDYVSAKDLKLLMPTVGINTCVNIIKEVREIDMPNQNCYVPQTKPFLALTRIIKKKLGIK